jgi:glycosyltransferase involved in cell wall biosynthesis
MKLPKVLVFTPVYDKKDYSLDKFLEYAKNLSYPNFKHILIDNSATQDYVQVLVKKTQGTDIGVYHVTRGNNTRESLARAQNFARKIAIDGDYDYMFSLESDIMCPHDAIQRLMIHNLPVTTGLYLIGDKKHNTFLPCVTLLEFKPEINMYGTRLLKLQEVQEFIQPGVKQVAAGGFGCCLIARSVFTKITFMYEPHLDGHSDIWFFNECFRQRFPVVVDTEVKCDHDMSDWNEVKDR